MSAPAADAADATFQALREEFLEDAAEDLKNFLSYLNEAIAGSRPVDEVLHDARRVAVMLVGGANGFELPLVGVAAQRFDNYVASLSPSDNHGLNGLVYYAETLLDLLDAPDENEETASHLARRLPAKGGFDPDEIDVSWVFGKAFLNDAIERRGCHGYHRRDGSRVALQNGTDEACLALAYLRNVGASFTCRIPVGLSVPAVQKLRIQGSVTGDRGLTVELLRHEIRSATAHHLGGLPIPKQIDNSCCQNTGCARRNQNTIPAVANDIGAAGHSR